MQYLRTLNLSPDREALYKSIMLEEEIDEQVLRLMDHPPIADDITEQTGIPLAVTRHLVQTAHSVESSREGMPPCSPPECPPTSPACYSDSSSSSDDEDEEDGFELHTAASYPRIKSPKALRELVKAIHDAVDEAALAHAEDAREAQDAESSAREKAEAQKRAAVALQEESERLMAELRKKNEQQKQKQTAHKKSELPNHASTQKESFEHPQLAELDPEFAHLWVLRKRATCGICGRAVDPFTKMPHGRGNRETFKCDGGCYYNKAMKKKIGAGRDRTNTLKSVAKAQCASQPLTLPVKTPKDGQKCPICRKTVKFGSTYKKKCNGMCFK